MHVLEVYQCCSSIQEAPPFVLTQVKARHGVKCFVPYDWIAVRQWRSQKQDTHSGSLPLKAYEGIVGQKDDSILYMLMLAVGLEKQFEAT